MQSSSSSISSEDQFTSGAPSAIRTYFGREYGAGRGSNDPVGNRTIRSTRTVSPPCRSRSLTAASLELTERSPRVSIGEVSTGRQRQLGSDAADNLLVDRLLRAVRRQPPGGRDDQPYAPDILGNRLRRE